MPEIWLQSNRRAALIASLTILPVALIAALGGLYRLIAHPLHWGNGLAAVVGGAFLTLSLATMRAAQRPRLAYDGRNLQVNVGLVEPAVIPIELVEGFLLGKGPAYLQGKDDYKTETTTLILRLAERAPEWEKLPTDVRVAAWCGHHITLRGTWTEPLSLDVVNRLNQRLYDVQHASQTAVST